MATSFQCHFSDYGPASYPFVNDLEFHTKVQGTFAASSSGSCAVRCSSAVGKQSNLQLKPFTDWPEPAV